MSTFIQSPRERMVHLPQNQPDWHFFIGFRLRYAECLKKQPWMENRLLHRSTAVGFMISHVHLFVINNVGNWTATDLWSQDSTMAQEGSEFKSSCSCWKQLIIILLPCNNDSFPFRHSLKGEGESGTQCCWADGEICHYQRSLAATKHCNLSCGAVLAGSLGCHHNGDIHAAVRLNDTTRNRTVKVDTGEGCWILCRMRTEHMILLRFRHTLHTIIKGQLADPSQKHMTTHLWHNNIASLQIAGIGDGHCLLIWILQETAVEFHGQVFHKQRRHHTPVYNSTMLPSAKSGANIPAWNMPMCDLPGSDRQSQDLLSYTVYIHHQCQLVFLDLVGAECDLDTRKREKYKTDGKSGKQSVFTTPINKSTQI